MDRCLALLRVGLLRILSQAGDHDLTSSIRCISGRIIQIQTNVRKLRLLYYKSKLSVDELSHRRHFNYSSGFTKSRIPLQRH